MLAAGSRRLAIMVMRPRLAVRLGLLLPRLLPLVGGGRAVTMAVAASTTPAAPVGVAAAVHEEHRGYSPTDQQDPDERPSIHFVTSVLVFLEGAAAIRRLDECGLSFP